MLHHNNIFSVAAGFVFISGVSAVPEIEMLIFFWFSKLFMELFSLIHANALVKPMRHFLTYLRGRINKQKESKMNLHIYECMRAPGDIIAHLWKICFLIIINLSTVDLFMGVCIYLHPTSTGIDVPTKICSMRV